ncbi:MAG: tRNA (adenosine(37)-N6)-threonylcarbamoyltransferase complex ATPase subunit type 1 TsaE [Clostridiales bacterium]|nr:tRNA (adenosine(37)-N6)-threonylcarbamoyltransferase complex ATPase subunit type 1 TsaE [Clostridiales bacterium]
MKLFSHSVEETHQIGKRLAAQLHPGDVLLMIGDMGAGKSELTRGIARGLGITGYVTSPTFTILQVHDEGRMPLYHFDWYRLSDVEELYELSMDEYLYGNGVSVVEWPSRAEEAIPECYLEVTLTPVDDSTREIAFRPVGGFHSLDVQQMTQEKEGSTEA